MISSSRTAPADGVELLRVTRDGSVHALVDGDIEVGGHAAAGERVVFSHATPRSLGELSLLGAGPLTTFGEAAAAHVLARPEEREIVARDGYPVHGWVAVPAGEGPFPVILQDPRRTVCVVRHTSVR